MRRKSDFTAYLALRAAIAACRAGPRPLTLAAGAGLGRMARTPLGLRRAVADRNIAAAFPELSAAERAALARRSYAHFGRMATDILRFASAGPGALVPLVEGGAEAAARLRALLARGRGLIVLTGHLGNWELAGGYLAASGMPLAAVVKPPANPYVARYLEAARRRLGIETIPMPEARSGVLAALRAGKIVALVADQGAIRSGTWAPFFGRPTQTAEGPGLFAARAGAPVLFGALLAREDGGYRGVLDTIEEEPLGETREVIQRVAERYWARLEAEVRRAPEQYLWTHRLWKRQPPGVPAVP